ncbi:MAG: hypothetical protein JJ863_08450 [Deltaproteobacteria bacterium]|nr:hypothetical protein [Deltaproteobacteria bacterium]
MARVLAWMLLASAALTGCVERCPCGAKTSDPFELHDPSFEGTHRLPTESSLDASR